MEHLGTLYRFELKKIVKRKIVWITAVLCLICIAVTVTSSLTGNYYVEGKPVETHYEMFLKDSAYRKALSGRAIDEELLKETVDAYRKIPAEEERYTLTEEYETCARPYSEIYYLISEWMGLDFPEIQGWEADEEEFYQARAKLLEEEWNEIPLNEREKEFWREQEKQMKLPITYVYHEGYEIGLDSFLTIGVLMLLFVAICLSGTFSEEHTRRTDQLILSSAKGKTTAYWAKILAGITVSVTASALMALVSMGLCMCIFGTEGFETALQIAFPTYSYPMTMGQACLIAYGALMLTSVPAAVFVMILSEWLHNGIATLAVSTGLVIMGGMISIPSQYRIAAQIWDWLPMTWLSTWNVFDSRMLNLFGHCFVSWQIVPVIYILCSIALAFAGKRIYRRYQVSGR